MNITNIKTGLSMERTMYTFYRGWILGRGARLCTSPEQTSSPWITVTCHIVAKISRKTIEASVITWRYCNPTVTHSCQNDSQRSLCQVDMGLNTLMDKKEPPERSNTLEDCGALAWLPYKFYLLLKVWSPYHISEMANILFGSWNKDMRGLASNPFTSIRPLRLPTTVDNQHASGLVCANVTPS